MTDTALAEIATPEVSPSDLVLDKFPKWTLAHWCIVVTAASFLILVMLPEARLSAFDVPTGGENIRIARSLSARGAFADPFATMRTGTTAHVAPVYPALYALVLRLMGTGYAALLALWFGNVLCLALQMGLLPLLSYRLGLGVLPGILAAAMGAVSLHAPIDTRWECFLAGLLLICACLATERGFRSETRTAALIAGALWGILILTNPVLVLLLIAWPLCWVFTQPSSDPREPAKRFVLIVAASLLIVSPWIGRNYLQFGSFIFVRDNLGLELYTSNNPCAAPSIRENIQSGCHARTHPNPNAAVAAQVVTAGEVQFNRDRLRDALTWMTSQPAAFFWLTARRVRLFWFPDLERRWESILVWTVTLFSFAGIWRMAKKRSILAYVFGTAWLLFPLVYYVTQFEARYSYPIYWTFLLPAACALLALARHVPFLHRIAGKLPASNG